MSINPIRVAINAIRVVRRINAELKRKGRDTETMLINQGRLLGRANRQIQELPLSAYAYKVFSQWGEDGIIQHIVDNTEIAAKTFIEFGVETFAESNCRFLMMKDNWSGFIMDSNEDCISECRASHYFWRHDLQAINATVTAENVNTLVRSSGFLDPIGLISIDVDGVDYWVLKALEVRSAILIVEYNAVFGPERAISVPYDPHFNRTEKHYSNLYFGASLAAMEHEATRKGYTLIGTSGGCNAFFLHRDFLQPSGLQPLSVKEAFTPSQFRESRHGDGTLSHLRGAERYDLIAGLPVVNVITGDREQL